MAKQEEIAPGWIPIEKSVDCKRKFFCENCETYSTTKKPSLWSKYSGKGRFLYLCGVCPKCGEDVYLYIRPKEAAHLSRKYRKSYNDYRKKQTEKEEEELKKKKRKEREELFVESDHYTTSQIMC